MLSEKWIALSKYIRNKSLRINNLISHPEKFEDRQIKLKESLKKEINCIIDKLSML